MTSHRIPPKEKRESHRVAAQMLAKLPVTKIPCTCRCHNGHTRAHPDEKCTCRGGQGFMAQPAEQIFLIRVSRRVLFFLSGTQAYCAIEYPEDPNHQPWMARLFAAPTRTDGAKVVEVNRQEALELAERGDDLAVSAGDGASDMSMGVGDFSQADSLADLNAGRALVAQVHRKLAEADGTLRVKP